MRHFRRVTEGVDVSPMLAELEAAPDLWNEHRERTGEGSPHAGADDIWLRFFPRERLLTQDDYRAEGRCVFYPAWERLPSLHRLAFDLMHALRCTEMGGVLITRIPPGGRVLPHDDRGSWHAEFFGVKCYLPLASNARCVNVCLDEEVQMRAGEVWSFNNLDTHSVENNGATDRITVILCYRGEGQSDG